jgi:hypothetical protein
MPRFTRILTALLLLTYIFSVGARGRDMATDAANPLALTIEQKDRTIVGTVKNTSEKDVRVGATLLGWWEFTTVFFFDGQRWHEAPLKKGERARMGAAQPQILKPNAQMTFSVNLDEYEFPVPKSQGRIRLVTHELWSNIADFKTPEEASAPTR